MGDREKKEAYMAMPLQFFLLLLVLNKQSFSPFFVTTTFDAVAAALNNAQIFSTNFCTRCNVYVSECLCVCVDKFFF